MRRRALGECEDAVLAGTDILPAPLDDVASADRVVERPAADAITGLEDADGCAPFFQLPRRRQARQARPDDHHIHPAIGKVAGRSSASVTAFPVAARAAADVSSRRKSRRSTLTVQIHVG